MVEGLARRRVAINVHAENVETARGVEHIIAHPAAETDAEEVFEVCLDLGEVILVHLKESVIDGVA